MEDEVFSEAEWDYLRTFRLDQLPSVRCTGDAVRCEGMARFGQALFFDPRFSGEITVAGVGAIGESGKVSCVTCHDPRHYFADSRADNAQSLGTAWTKRNVPGLVDAARLDAYIWSGKYSQIEDVLELALTSPAALHSTKAQLAGVIRLHYLSAYDRWFDYELPPADDVIYKDTAFAIASYERMLLSGPTPFDRYLAGEVDAIDDDAKRGARLFIGKAMCSECHDGPMFSDQRFHNTGVEPRGAHVNPMDHGRADVTGDLRDDGHFRTPTLRHITETAPYMHTGSLAKLADVIEFYRWGGDVRGFVGHKDDRIQPLPLTDDDARDLEAFLRVLTGPPVPAVWTTAPAVYP